jgi:hypothetical protein
MGAVWSFYSSLVGSLSYISVIFLLGLLTIHLHHITNNSFHVSCELSTMHRIPVRVVAIIAMTSAIVQSLDVGTGGMIS